MNTMNTIYQLVASSTFFDGEELEDVKHDTEFAIKNLILWLQHIPRSVQQNQAKIDIMAALADNPKSCLWLRDWAQKVLPQSFREAQKDYFAKKGMSLHIDVFLKSSEAGKMQKYVFFTILNTSEQDHLDTLSLASLVLPKFHDEAGGVDILYGKSDTPNAMF